MTYDFKSGFKEQLCDFVRQKKAVGISYESNISYLMRFDKMCFNHYPHTSNLTKEICDMFATKKDTENGNAFRNRISPIREFAKFIIARGENAYVIPMDLVKKSPRNCPYIYSKDEISAIWNEFDNLEPIAYLPARHIVLPAMIRLLYCCGLRPVEAARLTAEDVDLSRGRLFIRESKGHKDRIVMTADDVTGYLLDYEKKISALFPNRKWFFPNSHGGFCDYNSLNYGFLQIRRKLGLYAVSGKNPVIYDFRHTYATHKLYEWMRDGADLYAMLPYLSAYMGHAQLSDTYYYIHLVPGQYEAISGLDFSRYEELLPEVCYAD